MQDTSVCAVWSVFLAIATLSVYSECSWYWLYCIVQELAAYERISDDVKVTAERKSTCLFSAYRCQPRSTVSDWAFPVDAAYVWNSLPDLVTSAPSIAVFRSRLKTHLFNISYPSSLWLYCTVPAQWRLVTLDTSIVLAYLLTYLQTLALDWIVCFANFFFIFHALTLSVQWWICTQLVKVSCFNNLRSFQP